MAKAIQEAKDRSDPRDMGRVLKVLFLDDKGEPVGEFASQQMPEDPFESSNISGLVEPPYNLAQLAYLAEIHPVHSAALEQKTADVIGKGWQWEPREDDKTDDGLKKELDAWFNELAPDEQDMKEVLTAGWLDYETLGWGLFELVRDSTQVVRKVYHVPGHTVRAHKDGFRLCQIRNEKRVWFRRWGSPEVDGKEVQVDAKSGSKTKIAIPANDLLVIKKTSRRSTWYGIPGYISAIGWITLALAARDDNLFFFANRREPRWAIILTNLEKDSEIEEDIRRAFTVDLRQPYRNIVLPIEGAAKVDFQQLSDTKNEGSFGALSERADRAIMIAHRVPGERIANANVGALGGSIVAETSRIYKEGVVSPAQELFGVRLNKLAQKEFPRGQKRPDSKPEPLPFVLTIDELDIGGDREDLDQAIIKFRNNTISLREVRHELGLGPLMEKKVKKGPDGFPQLDADGEPVYAEEETESPLNDLLFKQIPASQGGGGPEPPQPEEEEAGMTPDVQEKPDGEQGAEEKLAMRHAVQQLVLDAREQTARLDRLLAQ